MDEIFEAWLIRNRAHLADYLPKEIANLALTCGFSTADISEGLSHGFRNVQTRTTLKQRMDYFVGREIKLIDTHGGNPDLSEQWHCLAKKLIWDIDFEEVA